MLTSVSERNISSSELDESDSGELAGKKQQNIASSSDSSEWNTAVN